MCCSGDRDSAWRTGRVLWRQMLRPVLSLSFFTAQCLVRLPAEEQRESQTPSALARLFDMVPDASYSLCRAVCRAHTFLVTPGRLSLC